MALNHLMLRHKPNDYEVVEQETAEREGVLMEVVVTIAEFKQQLRVRGYAPATIEIYRKNLDQFAAWLTRNNISDLRQVTRQVMLDYQSYVMAQVVAMETRALKIRAVKRLFEHLEENHRLLISPTEGIIETCRRHRRIGPVLTMAEMKKLLEQPNLSLKTHIRDRAVMEVLYSTGIRLNELLCLEIYHVDLIEDVLYIRHGKGGRQRVVPLGKTAAAGVKAYLEKIRPCYAKKNPKERRLFLLITGRAMTPASVRGLLVKYRDQAGIKTSVSPHTLRRTCATHLLQNGADIRHIQELLGHKSLKTTQAYTKIMPREVKQIHDKTHPNQEQP